MSVVYVLSLENNKYYVGKTDDLRRRFLEHMNGHGRSAAWTKKYKPLKILETYAGADGLEEDKITLSCMIRYGIDHVRGGPYVSTVLSKETRAHILHRARMACDLCAVCGSADHFMKHCKQKRGDRTAKCEKCNSCDHFTEDCQPISANA